MPRAINLDTWRTYFEARDDGLSVPKASRKAGISPNSAYAFEQGLPSSSGRKAAIALGRTHVGGHDVTHIDKDADLALKDFGYFRRRYFGRRSVPWQERAAYQVLSLLETPEKEFAVVNCPPGSGKSTLFTHDIPAWLIVRRRSIRILLGSRTGRQARVYVERLRQTLESTQPLQADPEELRRGMAVDAVATIPGDFGQFKPEGRGQQWTNQQFYVVSPTSTGQKEPTVAGYGQDEASLGTRVDLVIWDDLVDDNNIKGDGFDKLVRFWQTNAERRLEPGGLLVLQGQRMAPQDLYRWALDVRTVDDTPKYHHIVYPAHKDSACVNKHRPTDPPWPDGCLLDPIRLPWKQLENDRAQDRNLFDIQFQQEDGDATGKLVEKEWLNACYDGSRTLNTPPDTDARLWSAVTVDPAPDNWWAIQWWLVDADAKQLYLMDVIRRRMSNLEFLTQNLDTGVFSGALQDLLDTSREVEYPLQTVIVETNAAQKWLLNQPYAQKWGVLNQVLIQPHTTHMNKNDPAFGVGAVAEFIKQGRVNLPDGDPYARVAVKNLTSELLVWPNGRTSDQVMAFWFMVLALNNHYAPAQKSAPRFERPSWMQRSGRGLPSKLAGIR
jgi:hypothetical protein